MSAIPKTLSCHDADREVMISQIIRFECGQGESCSQRLPGDTKGKLEDLDARIDDLYAAISLIGRPTR